MALLTLKVDPKWEFQFLLKPKVVP